MQRADGSVGPAVKVEKILKLPPLLMIHLQRFSYDSAGGGAPPLKPLCLPQSKLHF